MFVLAAIIGLVACEEIDVPRGTPSCIKSKIRDIQKEPVRNPPAAIWQCEYQGQTVYYIPSYCCDNYSELYDEHCNLICHPDGGITGTGDCACTDFFTNRTNVKLIWNDNR